MVFLIYGIFYYPTGTGISFIQKSVHSSTYFKKHTIIALLMNLGVSIQKYLAGYFYWIAI